MSIGIDTVCRECGSVRKNLRALGLHVYRAHKITSRAYYEKHFDFRCQRCGKKRNLDMKEGYGIRRLLTRSFCSVQCYADSTYVGHHITKHGYVLKNVRYYEGRDKEMAKAMATQMRGRAVLEHRLVMARHLGRPLADFEQVHHRNGKRADNRIENLELRIGAHGSGATAADVICPHCKKAYVG